MMPVLPDAAAEANVTDVELVQLALGGDTAALRNLYLKYFGFCISEALQRGCQREDAEDIAQELFFQLAEGRGWHVTEARTKDGRLHPYLATVVRIGVLNVYRRRNFQFDEPMNGESAADAVLVPMWHYKHETPEQQLLRAEQAKLLHWALASLPQRLREVAHLRYVECLTGREIAARLNLSHTTIPSYLTTIRDRIRPLLSRLFPLPPRGRTGFVRMASYLKARPTHAENSNLRRRRARAKARKIAAVA